MYYGIVMASDSVLCGFLSFTLSLFVQIVGWVTLGDDLGWEWGKFEGVEA